ncbi:nucleotide exchange factor GrpE [Rhodoplanes elegans]|uniref:Protein GrpE n=1 Tax=Rhodoplanes elegans TaxID=29408 RepID=A0A327KQB4_9BRAD|nr:nucleotide exchange factor GrpE [Rhodoplanes elegans]MBK5959926.1 nucleotide exchange factor GrpE [Rhodoplanes elegans]RAI39813.1 nucleotide exchange factor GrpE [Rhodoplanes elegans]
MTDDKAGAATAEQATSASAPDTAAATAAYAATAANAEAAAGSQNPAGQDPAVDVAALAKEAAEHKDRLLRTLAEMENLRRRTEREVADARAYGISGFARDMLAVADNLRRALEAVSAENRDALPAPVKSFLEGVELTERELLKGFERNGVKRFDPQGQKFDPNVHQAMFEIPDQTTPNGTVVQVVQAGYMIGERVLRPALVGVSKGGPKVAPGAAGEAAAPAAGEGLPPGGTTA